MMGWGADTPLSSSGESMIDGPTSPPPKELGDLIREAQAGSEEASRILFERCREPLLAVIRRVLYRPLRKLFDSDDFLIDTMAQVFVAKFSQDVLNSPPALWRYLRKIAENKVRDATRKHLRTRRFGFAREQPFPDDLGEQEPEAVGFSPDETLLLQEFFENRMAAIMSGMPLVYRAVARRILIGHSVRQIAEEFQLESKQVYRVVESLKKKLRA
jgi:RNA polymerase sigma factor (sigma-70 family)